MRETISKTGNGENASNCLIVSILDLFKKAATSENPISATSIWKCINGQFKQAGNYIWRKENAADSPDFQKTDTNSKSKYPKRENTGKSKKVCQIDPETGEMLNVFQSIGAAARSVNINSKGIVDVIVGKQKTAGGYYWQEVL